MINKIKEVAKDHDLKFDIDLVGRSDCVNLSERVIKDIEEAALEKGYKYKRMNSGAVHDSVMLTEIADVGMIFVPSIKGKSHCPDEMTNYKDIEIGCDLLLNTVLKLAGN